MMLDNFLNSQFIRKALVSALLILLLLNLLFAKLSVEQRHLPLQISPTEQTYLLPSPNILRAASLNYHSFSSDLVWINALIYFGSNSTQNHSIQHLPEYAMTASELDPYFYSLYKWYPDVYIGAKHPVSEERIEKTNQFLKRGMKYFPRDHRLPETAASNYIGYSADAPAPRRLRESIKAIEYLQRAAKLPGASSNVPFLLDYFYGRKAKLEAELSDGEKPSAAPSTTLSENEKETYLRLYLLAPDPHTRARLAGLLSRYGIDENTAFERARNYTQRLQTEHTQRLNYLPVDLWSTIVNPKEFDAATATANR